MNDLLLDTHVWWWALSEPERLSDTVVNALENAERERLFVSSISMWEISLLISRGRIRLRMTPEDWFERALTGSGIRLHPITPNVALEAYRLPGNFHRDPADRLLVATARVTSSVLVTRDEKILEYPYVTTLWQ